MLTKRCTDIIILLKNSDKPLTTAEIADKVKASTRTVRYDLDAIEDWLLSVDNAKLVRTPKVGFTLLDPDNKVLESLKGISLYDYKIDSEGRVRAIICLLLTANKKLSVQGIADKLQVSIATVAADLKEVRLWAEENSIKLVSKPHLGIYIEAEERVIRWAIHMVLREMLNVADRKRELIKSNFKEVTDISRLYLMEDIARASEKYSAFIIESIKAHYKSDKYVVSDTGFCDLYLSLLLIISRHCYADRLTLSKQEEEFILARSKHVDDSEIISSINEALGIKLSYYERLMLDGQLLSTKACSFDNEEVLVEDIMMVKKLLDSLAEELGLEINRDDKIIKEMVFHVNALLYRVILNIPCGKNCMIGEIRASFGSIYDSIDRNFRVILKERIGREKISQDEVAYLTMYVIAAIFNNYSEVEKKKDVIIVCGSNIATSEILKLRLNMLFSNVNIIRSISYSEFVNAKEDLQCDLIISTLPIESDKYNCVFVNPMLNTEDITKLVNNFTLKMNSMNINKYIEATIEIAKRVLHISPDEELKFSLELTRSIEKEMNSIKYKKSYRLADVLKIDYVKARVKVKDWKQAVLKAGEPLLESGIIQQKTIDEIIEIKNRLGAYFVIDKSVAMPHLMVPGICRPYLTLITLDKPVRFGHKDNDPVEIIILLVSGDKTSHIGIIEDIVDILNKDNAAQAIERAESSEKLIRTINSFIS